MCGIAGLIALHERRPVPQSSLRAMAKVLTHRGPDDEGFFVESGIGLASRRLSIIDVSDGHQPVANEDGSVIVIFNGELFDYQKLRAELVSKGHRLTTR